MSEKPTYEDLEQRVRELEQMESEYKRAEEAVEHARVEREMILDSQLELVIYEDTDMRILWPNKAACQSVNMTREELVGRYCYEIWSQRTEPCEDCPVTKAMETGQPKSVEKNTPDGRAWFIRGYPVKDSKGKIIGAIEVTQDITDRKRAEEEQKKLQAQLSNALEMAHLGPWECDVPNNLFIFNDHFYKIFRTTAEQVGGYIMTADEYAKRFLHPDDLHVVREEMKKAIETTDPNYSRQLEHRIFYFDGTVGHISVRFFIVKDADGRTVKTYGVNQDITDRKKAEDALKESEEFSTSLLEHSPNAILVFNPDTSIRYVNPLFEKITGFTSKEVLGKKAPYPWWDNDPKCGAAEQRKQNIEGVHELERRYRKKNGDYSWVEINIIPIFRYGALKYSLSTWIDISERKKAEKEKESLQEKLQRSQKMESLGLLAGGVAHDLNNVLAGIVSYPELLLMDLPENSKLRKPIETIEESGHRAVSIVQDLLTIARGVATTKEPLNLNELIKDYLESPESKKIEQYYPTVTIETNLDSTLLNVNGSHVHLRKVVMNLVINASEAIEGGGKVTISTTNRYVDRPLKLYDDVKIGEYAVLSVSDDGLGILPVDRERIFEPFYSKKVLGRSGTGLGLAVVWNLIKEHEGYINVTSDEDGTTFDMYLPITREELFDKTLVIPIENIKGKGEKILVVDDIDSQREITCNILEKLDYKASSVSSGEEAVEYIKEHRVDLILLDMIMDPGINGRETYERIIRIHPGQRAVIVSGFAETDEVKAAQKLGAGQYIKKPLTLQKIGLAIKEELEKS